MTVELAKTFKAKYPKWFRRCCTGGSLSVMRRWRPGKVKSVSVDRIGRLLDKKNRLQPGTAARAIRAHLAAHRFGRLL